MKKRFSGLLTLATLALATPISNSAAHPPASHLHSGEYCTKADQGFYHRHGYTCKRASDGRLRLFDW